MKNFSKISIVVTLTTAFIFGITSVFAATSPALNTADTFGVLSSTYTNTVAGTTINGDIGYTTPPAMAPVFSGTLHVVDPTYNQAGINQNAALANLNSQGCTFSFAPGAIDLSTDTTHGPIGVYGSGVYCVTGAASIGVGGITLDGTGTYIFKITGALTTVANSMVTTINGASSCDIFWTPTQATTFGANTTFKGNIIDNAGITMGANSTLLGRALAFGGTVTTDKNTITVPICTIPPVPATLHVIKNVVNGTAISSNFNLYVKFSSGSSVAGSPGSGAVAPGTSYTLNPGTYIISEDINSSYTQSFSGDCSSSGSVLLSSGDNKTCTVTNTYIQPVSGGSSSGGGGGSGGISVDSCLDGDYSYSYYDGICGTAPVVESTGAVINTESTGAVIIETIIIPIKKIPIVPPSNKLPVTPPVVPTISNSGSIENVVPKTPGFPNTGIYSENNTTRNIIIIVAILILISTSIALIYEKQKN